MNKFKSIILIGSTNLLYLCFDKIKYVYNEIPVSLFDFNENDFSDIYQNLINIEEKTLVFSIMNKWLVPNEIIEQKNLTIINLHHSFLPDHPGRNAEAWSIFECDTFSGITWHYIDSGVDTGDIIYQSKLNICEDTTSISLLKSLNNLAIDSLEIFLPIEKYNKRNIKKQEIKPLRTIHKSYTIPNNGFIDLSWNKYQINRFINSMNYGILKILGEMKVSFENKTFTFKEIEFCDSYSDINSYEINFEKSQIYYNHYENGIVFKKIKLEED